MLCAVSMAVDRGEVGGGMLSQVAGAGSPARLLAASVSRRLPAPLSASL